MEDEQNAPTAVESTGSAPIESPPFSVEEFIKNLRKELAPVTQETTVGAAGGRDAPESGKPVKSGSSLESYASAFANRAPLQDRFFSVLSGWNDSWKASREPKDFELPLKRFLMPEKYQKTTGGFYLRMQGKGIVVNPGWDFLKHFHDAGFFVQDIDVVVVTSSAEDNFGDVDGIYRLNYELNLMSSDLHVIRYYIHQNAYQKIVSQLRPHFKQERHTIHSLEFYLDSPDMESIALDEDLNLHYFPCQQRTPYPGSADESLNLIIEMQDSQGGSPLSVAWLMGKASPIAMERASDASLLVVDGERASADWLPSFPGAQQKAPAILCCSFNAKEGDRRLQQARQLRHCLQQAPHVAVLPSDVGMQISLPGLQTACSICNGQTPVSKIKVAKSTDLFGSLFYFCPDCTL